ncbi:BREX system P-loop protein BrxC [Akkermansiaceae bacterium]|nr:BREX system P-loop protein BrxC [Akkermansiaceae bacterium]
MKTKDIFLKDPLSWTLANEGVSSNNDADEQTLRYELDTFVCDGEYQVALDKILNGYLKHLGGEQAGAWISGFYGSGKSHLVKVLRYLWTNYEFADGSKAREITTLPTDISDALLELSRCGKQGKGLHAAGGTLKAGSGDVRMRILQIVFQSVDLPEKYSEARFVMDLRDDEKLDSIRKAITDAGKEPAREISKLYTSRALQQAYLDEYPHLGSLSDVGKALREQYPSKMKSITIPEMVEAIRRALAVDDELPCTVLVLDEIQQYINNSADIANDVQEVVEACQKMLDGKVIVVGTGQSALSDTPALQRIMGRFPIKRHLKDNDVEKVVRAVVLQKKPEHISTVDQLVTQKNGEISRQLKDTKIASLPEDRDGYVPDFPLLPVRMRFWKHVLHHTDATGSTAQMRTQLRVTHEACRSAANKELGAIIPGDFIYDQLSSDLLISGELQKRFQEIIEDQKNKAQGELRSRICSLVFLINKLPDSEGDLGIRADAEHIADLLTTDLSKGTDELRRDVPILLKALHEESILMDVEGEYRLQTTEGAAWEGEFRRRFASIKNDEPQIAAERSQKLSSALGKALGRINVQQGHAKVSRNSQTHYGSEKPPKHDGPVIWIRDGFTESEKSVMSDVNSASQNDATVFVFVPKAHAEDIKAAIAASVAAEETVSTKGTPSTDEGKEARQGIISRQTIAEGKIETLLGKLTSSARVFLAGGQEIPVIGLHEAVEDAATQVVDRLFPKFSTADFDKWGTVWKRAKEGNATALESIGYQGDPDKHQVAKELILYIGGAGKKGTDVVKNFTSGVYGWPKDAVDATIATLIVSQHLGATIDGKPVRISELDQRSLGKTHLKVEHPVLAATDKLKVRKLFKAANQSFQPGEESAAARDFVITLKTLASSAGGDAPAPEHPQPPLLTELEGLSGNELLHKLFVERDPVEKWITNWKSICTKLESRLPEYQLASELLKHAQSADLDGVEEQLAALDSVRAQRTLLDDPSPVANVLKTVGSKLRDAVRAACQHHEETLAAELAKLDSHPTWQALDTDKQNSILSRHGVKAKSEPPVGTESEVHNALQSCDLATWKTHADAISTRCDAALAEAIKESEPKAKRVSLPQATIKSAEELDAWLTSAKSAIEETLKDGPAIV